ncbi:hypothetical protein [Candidatus Enterovibrio altilux]|uniref:hypothetical protein n=1 Tax=Candidatus Enterovibrio altilux TaxID=1927128 RepID=UPI003741FAAE
MNSAQLPLPCPCYSCISKRVRMVNVTFKTKNKGTIQYLNIYSTSLTVYKRDALKVTQPCTDGKLRI